MMRSSGAGPAGRRGVAGWLDVRGRHMGAWALLLNRVTGLLLVAYLYLHLGVLSLLARGPRSWKSFLNLATSPGFLALDVFLIVLILLHALNGIRLSLVGTGILVRRQKAMFVILPGVGAAVLIVAAVLLLGKG